jgi:hypothetical protein
MADVTFRDFAGAIMQGDVNTAATVLQQLLALAAPAAHAAAAHFQAQAASAGPAFMAKAMGLRSAVATGSPDAVAALLRDCFGLADEPAASAAAHLLRPPTPRPT